MTPIAPMAPKAESVESVKSVVGGKASGWTIVPDTMPSDGPAPLLGTREPFWGPADGWHLPRWAASRFFEGQAPDEGVPAPVRLAASPLRLAGVFAVLGFFAVFVHQASIELQIVIGAPVFEEMVKFGVALLLVGTIPRFGRAFLLVALLRVAVAWTVGAGFGWVEHSVTYVDEPREIFLGRLLFHGGSTALSMATYCVLEGAADVRLRWFATIPGTALHYANNVGAVAFLAAPDAGLWWATGITALVYAALLAVPASSAWWRPRLEAWTRAHWPVRRPAVPEDWAAARALAAVAAQATAAPATTRPVPASAPMPAATASGQAAKPGRRPPARGP
jgi:hypothetical protein